MEEPVIWDISPPISPATPAFPGDTRYEQRWTARIGPDGPVNVSALALSPHLGAHADAPLHYADGGATAGRLDLAPFLGPCRVIHVLQPGLLVTPDHLRHAAAGLPPRVLVRTSTSDPARWVPGFAAFAPATITWLASLAVRLVGIDTPSVDPAESRTLDSHQLLRVHDMRVLENLVLDAVPEGDYELIALPLKLVDADASPVRAVLRPLR